MNEFICLWNRIQSLWRLHYWDLPAKEYIIIAFSVGREHRNRKGPCAFNSTVYRTILYDIYYKTIWTWTGKGVGSYLKNSITQRPETEQTNLMPLNPDPLANSMNSCSVRSFPPGFCVIIMRSELKTFFAAVVVSGTAGTTESTTITFPSSGIAL